MPQPRHRYADGEVTIRADRTFYSLTKSGKVRVECSVTGGGYARGESGLLGITVYPDWAPRGAGRFLELVRRRVAPSPGRP